MKTLLVCGLWYSGSSALIDYLKSDSKFIGFNNNFRETAFVRGGAGLHSTLEKVKSSAVTQDDLGGLISQLHGMKGGKHARKVNYDMASRYGAKYSFQVYSLAKDIESNNYSELELKSRYRSFFLALFELNKDYAEESVVVLNNDPAAHHLNVATVTDYFPESRVVAVRRDPRDAFVDLINSEKFPYNENDFFEDWIRKQQKSLRWLEQLDDKPGCQVVEFEKFICDSKFREQLSSQLGCVNGGNKKFFDPDKSKKNIGIYKLFPDQHVITEIERALSEFYVFDELSESALR